MEFCLAEKRHEIALIQCERRLKALALSLVIALGALCGSHIEPKRRLLAIRLCGPAEMAFRPHEIPRFERAHADRIEGIGVRWIEREDALEYL